MDLLSAKNIFETTPSYVLHPNVLSLLGNYCFTKRTTLDLLSELTFTKYVPDAKAETFMVPAF